ncbi:hypothetical protein OI450_03705 [Pectobacterium cacticida]|uniref:Uncharacterized protein n=1 Tax=Pectobacterium cacticida TaxID=69221 RepID=A0ABZ2GEJ2_9GAMM|nr:hypothetical protein [Pectobacterium cacticida]UYX08774.1 hypothetical protein OI450_03705 [Pectobacterium cacticida]
MGISFRKNMGFPVHTGGALTVGATTRWGCNVGDVSLSGFAALRMPVLIENPTRLASRGFLDKPRTTKLFRYIDKDYSPKFTAANKFMKIYMVGSSIKKVHAEFSNENYLLGDR